MIPMVYLFIFDVHLVWLSSIYFLSFVNDVSICFFRWMLVLKKEECLKMREYEIRRKNYLGFKNRFIFIRFVGWVIQNVVLPFFLFINYNGSWLLYLNLCFFHFKSTFRKLVFLIYFRISSNYNMKRSRPYIPIGQLYKWYVNIRYRY